MADEYILKSFDGGAQKTTLTASFTVGAASLTVANGSTFPDGSAGPFVVVVDRGLASEEKFLVDTTTGVNGTTFNIQQAGYDGSSPSAHSSGATVEHCLDAYSIEQANRYVNLQTARGDLVTHNGTTTAKIAAGTNNTVLVADSTVSAGVKWSTLGTASIADDSITGAKLASGAVSSDELAANAVTSDKIADAAVTAAKLASGASVPVGAVSAFAGSAAPSGYVLCNGGSYSRTNPLYAPLFAVIGTTYGAVDASSFSVPDLRSRFIAGVGTAQWSDALAEAGGTATAVVVTHQHTTPNHTHSATTGTARNAAIGGMTVYSQAGGAISSNTSVGYGAGGSTNIAYGSTQIPGGDHDHTFTITSSGSGTTSTPAGETWTGATNTANIPPYITLNYIIKL